MTLTEYYKKKLELESELIEKFKLSLKEWELQTGNHSQMFVTGNNIKCDLDNEHPLDTVNALNEFMDEVSDLPYHVYGSYDYTTEGYCYDGYAEDIEAYYMYHYQTHIKELPEKMLRDTVMGWFKRELKPTTASYNEIPDCKLMELFLSETIDFKTLQKLTHTNCGL